MLKLRDNLTIRDLIIKLDVLFFKQRWNFGRAMSVEGYASKFQPFFPYDVQDS